MTKHQLVARLTLPLLFCLGPWTPAGAQPPKKPESHVVLTTEEVVSNLVRRNLERAHALRAYQGTRTYRLEYRGFPGSRTAEMVVDVDYKSPATKEFTVRSESGSQLVIERVFKRLLQSEKEALSEENQRQVALNNDNYSFLLLGNEPKPGGSLYILSVEPRTKNKLLFRGKIWVDADDFAVVRMQGEPAKNPSFWIKDTEIEQVYSRVGDFWLPVSNRSNSAIRLGGHAVLTIDYRDYRITSASSPRPQNESVAGNR
ncbi:MAG: hypothetical protein WB421_16605 [Terriglobales bacterium]